MDTLLNQNNIPAHLYQEKSSKLCVNPVNLCYSVLNQGISVIIKPSHYIKRNPKLLLPVPSLHCDQCGIYTSGKALIIADSGPILNQIE